MWIVYFSLNAGFSPAYSLYNVSCYGHVCPSILKGHNSVMLLYIFMLFAYSCISLTFNLSCENGHVE